ncbi:hypothetical protein L2E82_37537 [Cichorium intybus]|uniref:Uncharacterized protein n=1 Tax=Cichorium intybus TaxID=13427 RepID=A0ACB9AFJ3_CICIN|nr:hypothetical protein L2E82_37537 [Cichorium intybus]
MSSTKMTGLIGMMIRRHNLLYASRPALFADGQLRGGFASISDHEDEANAMRERAKQALGNVMDAAKDSSEKLKDRVMGTDTKTAHPSKNPDLNHGVEKTDSSCEDVRDRPGGYS